MKKMFFLAATAALALSSCSSDELVQAPEVNGAEDGAVVFSAYAGRANRAIVLKGQELAELGFGVFAYEQGTTPWDTYRAGNTYPNFFYNQKVGQEVTKASEWTYTKAVNTLKDYVNAPAAIKALYTPGDVRPQSSNGFTLEQLAALTDIVGSTNIGVWVDGSEGLKLFANGDACKLSYAKYDALSGPLWSNKLSLFDFITDLTTESSEISNKAYNALPADAQAYYTTYEPATTDGVWAYSPIKYFSNNKEAKHSFFAYAPYQKDVKAVFTDKGPAVRYNATDDYDLLYATPAAAGTGEGQVANSVNKLIDVEKASITGVIGMNFQHALSKVSFEATYFVDKVHNGTHDAVEDDDFKDIHTTVVVRSVKFIGQVPSQGLLNLCDGSWNYEKIEESACEIVSGTTFTWDGTHDAAITEVKPLKNNMTVIPTQTGDKVKIQVVYDVITVDPANPKNNSTITNTITSDDSYELAQGKSYKFRLDLGLTSVKFGAKVAGWSADDTQYVDLPDNKTAPSNRR